MHDKRQQSAVLITSFSLCLYPERPFWWVLQHTRSLVEAFYFATTYCAYILSKILVQRKIGWHRAQCGLPVPYPHSPCMKADNVSKVKALSWFWSPGGVSQSSADLIYWSRVTGRKWTCRWCSTWFWLKCFVIFIFLSFFFLEPLGFHDEDSALGWQSEGGRMF